MALITFDQARAHVQRTDIVETSPPSLDESDLRLKMAQAEAIILDYIGTTSTWQTAMEAWTNEDTVPGNVQAAILMQLQELWRFRGDDPDGQGPAQTPGDLSPSVTNLLRRYRDPVLA